MRILALVELQITAFLSYDGDSASFKAYTESSTWQNLRQAQTKYKPSLTVTL
jgi:hypothetical protein